MPEIDRDRCTGVLRRMGIVVRAQAARRRCLGVICGGLKLDTVSGGGAEVPPPPRHWVSMETASLLAGRAHHLAGGGPHLPIQAHLLFRVLKVWKALQLVDES